MALASSADGYVNFKKWPPLKIMLSICTVPNSATIAFNANNVGIITDLAIGNPEKQSRKGGG
jgi:hypothetical protein